MVLDSLQFLSEHADTGVKYFSGVATYRQQFDLPTGVEPGQSLLLDPGAIGDEAEVLVHGQLAGSAWKKPYQMDIGKLVTAGSNSLEIRVAQCRVLYSRLSRHSVFPVLRFLRHYAISSN